MKIRWGTFVVLALPLAIASCRDNAKNSADAGAQTVDLERAYGPLRAPLVVRRSDVSLGEERITGLQHVIEEARPKRLDDLFHRLRAAQSVWKELNSGASFPGNSVLRVADDVTVAQFKSVLLTAAYSGYPHAEIVPADPKRSPRCKWRLHGRVLLLGELDEPPKDLRLHINVDRTETKFRWYLSETVTELDTMRGAPNAEKLAQALLEQWKLHGWHKDRRDLATDICQIHPKDGLTFAELVPLLDALCMNERELEGDAGARRVPIFAAWIGSR